MSTDINDTAKEQLIEIESEILRLREKASNLRRKLRGEKVQDYSLKDLNGEASTLSSLFGTKSDLIIVHNMGKACRYCTLWADGFNGIREHLENRAAFAVVSPDEPSEIKKFADGRGWRFKMFSSNDSDFTKAMGYETSDGNPMPGISTFHKDSDGNIIRITHSPLGPGDDFCSLWHIFDMLKEGPNGWEPQYSYK